MRALLYYFTLRLLAGPATGVALGCGWVAAVLLTFVHGGFFATNRADFSLLLTYLPWVMAVLIPALVMPVAAEGPRGVAERLATLPFSRTAVLLARFLTGWLLLGAWLLGFWPLVATLAYLGRPDYAALATGMLGAWLVAAVLLAVALLACVNARHAVSGLLLALAGCLGVVGLGAETAQQWAGTAVSPSWLQALHTLLPPTANLAVLQRGFLSPGPVLYLAGLTGLILAAALALQAPRRVLRRGPLALAAGALAATILGLLPALRNTGWDVSADRVNSLGAATTRILAHLGAPVTFTFYRSLANPDLPGEEREAIAAQQTLLARLQRAAPARVRVRVVDADAHALTALRAGVAEQTLPTGTGYFAGLVVSYGGRTATLPALRAENLARQEYDTLRLLLQAMRNPPRVTVIGVAEQGLPWQRLLAEQAAVTYTSAAQLTALAAPSLVMLVGDPALPPAAEQTLLGYLGGGGHVLLAADPVWRNAPASPGAEGQPFSTLLPQWGVEVVPGTVVADPAHPTLVTQPGSGPTAYPFWVSLGAGNVRAPLPAPARPLVWAEGGELRQLAVPPRLAATPLLQTAPSAVGVDAALLYRLPPQQAAQQVSGTAGARLLGVMLVGAFSAEEGAPPGQLLVVSDADWLSPPNAAEGAPTANLATFSALLDLALDQPDLTALRARGAAARPLARVEALQRALTLQTTRMEQKLVAELYRISQALAALPPENLAAAQAEQTQAFRARQFELRQQVRAQRQSTRRHLQRIENAALFANLVLMPALLAVGAYLLRRRLYRA